MQIHISNFNYNKLKLTRESKIDLASIFDSRVNFSFSFFPKTYIVVIGMHLASL